MSHKFLFLKGFLHNFRISFLLWQAISSALLTKEFEKYHCHIVTWIDTLLEVLKSLTKIAIIYSTRRYKNRFLDKNKNLLEQISKYFLEL